MVLEEFDKTYESTFDPCEVQNIIVDFPKIGVTCFSRRLFEQIAKKFNGKEIACTHDGNGDLPIYEIEHNSKKIALILSRIGAPACITEYEEIFAMGLEKLVVFGTCGVLDRNIDDLAIIIPNAALRDEGTSYHYAPASREIVVNRNHIEEFKKMCDKHNYSYIVGKTWTTDAPYRETRKKVLNRKNEGCICVEMECSAISALAQFRNKDIFQFFYAADNLDSAKWDVRSLGNIEKLSEKEKIGLLAIEFASKIK